ncbi:glycosyltransferase [Allorhizobium sp. BGMRC 0089]|uniref:glycosyltransferase family 2 protein n=1 Tax=Allorhizobium sonneratiae TaxID=2934936 RepID=UPI00203456E5|nr:glycosyltransferase [Allorhizobium sonneratiae]MCM2291450.1 glycosyltransferase [Allorhizobium sonneratiae]
MSDKPMLSICVPSRNRQRYFKETIKGLLRNRRQDVEFIFADNSDDHAVMNDFMADYRNDPRVIYLPATDQVLSMMDNWERAAHASTGEWVTFIGDDDFVEPDVAGLLERVVAHNPDIEAFSWGALYYSWPVEGEPVSIVSVAFDRSVMRLPKSEPIKRMFGWFEPTSVPTSGYSIYHSAIRRRLLDRIYAKYNNRYFEHAVVDYDMAMKVILEGEGFAFCQRPFSIFGACPESNSFSIGRLEDTKLRAKIFMEEFGRNFEDDPGLRDFPFSSFLGSTATIGVTQQWFREKYKVPDLPGWETGYAKACAMNTEAYRDREAFDTIRAGYETAFRNWKGGRFLKDYQPAWKGDIPIVPVSGAQASAILVRGDAGGAQTPAELWDVVSAMVARPEDIHVDEKGLPFPWEAEIASEELIQATGQTIQRVKAPKPENKPKRKKVSGGRR